MTRSSRNARLLASACALAGLVAQDAAVANHFILPCRGECVEPHSIVTGSMGTARELHTATLLADGRVLVAGGRDGFNSLDSAELYDPVRGIWTPTGSMTIPRVFHTATLLSDGRVLVVGGFLSEAPSREADTAEIYDPASGTWTPTGSMSTSRSWFAAVRLQDGRVLVAGGWSGGGFGNPLRSAELYDPATGRWTPTASFGSRYGHTLTLLDDGTVLALRGSSDGDFMDTLSDAQLYDPHSGTWTYVGETGAGSVGHSATLLQDGRVLVAGGFSGAVRGHRAPIAVLFDPATRVWSRATDLPAPRYDHTATVLPNGEILVAGGTFYSDMHMTIVRFDPVTMTWSRAADLKTHRSQHSMTLLRDGTVLIAGGSAIEWNDDVQPAHFEEKVHASAERYLPFARGKGSIPRKAKDEP